MKHIGDITKINWFEVEPVDVVTGGSPCQDLSVAGKRAGLKGERSGLFMEQIRCVKELRQADEQRGRTGEFIRPRYMVGENVPGAFSSGTPKGADFAAVIEEIIKVAEPASDVCVCVPAGGWPKYRCYYDEDGKWSIAYRVHDAQYWGVPQRRKRIALVADFGGLTAAEIMFDPQLRRETESGDQDSPFGDPGGESRPEVSFERKGLSGDFEQGGAQRERIAGTVEDGAGGASGCLTGWDCQSKRIFGSEGVCATLNSGEKEVGNITPSVFDTRGNGMVTRCAIPINMMLATRDKALGRGTGFGVGDEGDPQFTISAAHSHAVMCLNDQGGSVMSVTEDVSGCLRAQEHGHQPIVAGFKAGQGKGSIAFTPEQAATLQACGSGIEPTVFDGRGNGDGQTVCTLTGDHENRVTDYTALVAMSMQGFGDYKESEVASGCKARDYKDATDLVVSVDCRNGYENEELSGTIQAKENGGQSLNYINPVRYANIVRRLTPLECERLQGYPDGWTDIGEWTDSNGKKHKEADSPRYKALGNSIALPFWKWLLKRISAQYERDATLGSLFDGIGGFPLCWEQINGKGSARWASEIEEFPIAVTKLRFGED